MEDQSYEPQMNFQKLWLKALFLSLPPVGMEQNVSILDALPYHVRNTYFSWKYIVQLEVIGLPTQSESPLWVSGRHNTKP